MSKTTITPAEKTTAQSDVAADSVVSLEKLLKDIQALEVVVSTWDETNHRNTVTAIQKAMDSLHREALTRLIKAFRQKPEALAVFREAVTDPLVYAVLRHHELIKPSLHERVEKALDTVRPMLEGHGGNVELVSIELPSTAVIRLVGTCSGCPAADMTMTEGIEKAIKEYCTEITVVKKSKSVGVACNSDAGQPVYFASPFGTAGGDGWSYVTTLDEIPQQEARVIEFNGRSLLLAQIGQKLVCYENACAHLGLPLDPEIVENGIITCPHHMFRYALDSGECLTAPQVQLQTHAVRLVGNRVEVKIV